MIRGYSSHIIPDENAPDQIVWNEKSCKLQHKKSEYKIDITEVFRAHNFFSQSEII